MGFIAAPCRPKQEPSITKRPRPEFFRCACAACAKKNAASQATAAWVCQFASVIASSAIGIAESPGIGVVHDDVERAVRGNDRANRGVHLLLLRDIAGERKRLALLGANQRRGLLAGCRTPRGDGHIGAFGCERQGDSPPDTAARPGDHRGASAQFPAAAHGTAAHGTIQLPPSALSVAPVSADPAGPPKNATSAASSSPTAGLRPNAGGGGPSSGTTGITAAANCG